MGFVSSEITLDCRTCAVTEEKPKKQLHQKNEVYKVRAVVVEEYEFYIRKMIALYILKYGFDWL
jgi:hypothetical protein